MSTPSITIKLGPKDVVTKPAAEDFLHVLTDLAGVVSTSRIPYRDASVRLGSALWQLRQQSPYGTWKRLLALADITEHRAQRCMKVAAALSRDGVIDMELVERMREVARARGFKLPFVQTDAELASFKEAHRLVQVGTHEPARNQPRQTVPENTTTPLRSVGVPVRVGSPVPPVPSVATASPEAAALGLTDEQYAEWVAEEFEQEAAERDRENDTHKPKPGCQRCGGFLHEGHVCPECGGGHASPAASGQPEARPAGPRTQDAGLPLTGPQLPLAGLYEHAARVRERLSAAVAAVESGRVSAEAFEAVMVDLSERLRVLTG